jgi:hypothetical protein
MAHESRPAIQRRERFMNGKEGKLRSRGSPAPTAGSGEVGVTNPRDPAFNSMGRSPDIDV